MPSWGSATTCTARCAVWIRPRPRSRTVARTPFTSGWRASGATRPRASAASPGPTPGGRHVVRPRVSMCTPTIRPTRRPTVPGRSSARTTPGWRHSRPDTIPTTSFTATRTCRLRRRDRGLHHGDHRIVRSRNSRTHCRIVRPPTRWSSDRVWPPFSTRTSVASTPTRPAAAISASACE